jgi:hypothetical protein
VPVTAEKSIRPAMSCRIDISSRGGWCAAYADLPTVSLQIHACVAPLSSCWSLS